MLARTAAVAVLALGCATVASAATKNIDKTIPLSATGTLAMDVHNGRVNIRTWDKPEVEVHVRIEWTGLSASSDRYRDTTVDVTGTPDRVSITWRPVPYTARLWSLLEDGWSFWSDVQYDITAPKNARLQIRAHNASADIRDFSGPIDLSMHNGRARVDFASFTRGSRVEMHNGWVEFDLPSTSKFNFESRGHHASVDSDFRPITHANYFGRGENHVEGSVNGGGPELQIVSHNGVVRVHSKR